MPRAVAPAPITQSVNGTLSIVNGPDGDSMTRVEFQIKHWVKGRLTPPLPEPSTA